MTCAPCSNRWFVQGACFNADRSRRYALWRGMRADGGTMAVVLLNPSVADETALDPTLRRVLGFARAWDFGAVHVVNAFALVATSPRDLLDLPGALEPDPVNDEHIARAIAEADRVMVGWGSHLANRRLAGRRAEIDAMLKAARYPVYSWGLTESGEPRHPLYLPANTLPELYA